MTSILSVCIILHINITNTNRKVTVVKKIVIISVAVLGVMVALFALSARKSSDQSSLSESDASSREELSTDDLGQTMEAESKGEETEIATNTEEVLENGRESKMNIPCMVEGMWEEMAATLYVGDGFSIYIPDEDWQIYDETLEEPAQMAAVFSSEISIWVDYYAEKPLDVEARLLSEGYGYDTESKKMQKTEGELLLEVRIVGQQNDTWVIGSSYPAEYECGPRLDAIADTFEVAANQEENSSRTEQDEVYRNLIKQMLDTGIFPATDGTQFDGRPYDNHYCVMDIDDDGRDELLINFSNGTCMAGMVYYIYDYDRNTGEVYIEHTGFPMMTVYDNGYIKDEASHNHGRSNLDDFWPYYLYKYDPKSDKYVLAAQIDAWQSTFYGEGEVDPDFPTDKDLDGDGIVYYDMAEDYYTPTMIMDRSEYEKWCKQYTKGKEKEIHWSFIITEEEYYEQYPVTAVG